MALENCPASAPFCHMAQTRIREFREAAQLTLEQLAADIGISVSQMSRIERDEREPRLDELTKISIRLGAPIGMLIGEDDRSLSVEVVGLIGAGGAIDTSSEQIGEADPLYAVELPFPLPEDAIAFQVSGVSMWPRYDDGDVIVCSKLGTDIPKILGFEAAVLTDQGERFLKRIILGSRRGLFNLESHNASPMRDIKVTWASEVLTVIRASQVRKITDNVRRSLQRQIRRAV